MKTISRKTGALVTLVAIALLAPPPCAAKTKLGDVWKDPAYTGGKITKVLVIGIADHESRRTAFENQFVTAFRNRGIEAEASNTLIPGVEKLDKEIVTSAIEGKGFDAVIVTRVIGIDIKYTKNPGGYYAIPDTYYNSLYGYYGHAYTVVKAPDEHNAKTTASLETNLYSVETEKLVWTVQSKAYKKASLYDSIKSITKTLLKRLKKDDLV